MKTSLATALGAVQDQVSIGLELYPLGEHCEMPAGSDIDVDLQPGDRALPLVMNALGAMPSGGTPTSQALARALEYFTKGAGRQARRREIRAARDRRRTELQQQPDLRRPRRVHREPRRAVPAERDELL